MPKGTNHTEEILTHTITSEIVNRMVDGATTLEDLKTIKQVTGLHERKAEKTALIESVGAHFTNDQLHALTLTIAQNASALIKSEDQSFCCRETPEHFIKELLVLEAKRSGMTVELDKDPLAVNVANLVLPSPTADIYDTLTRTFYPQRSVSEQKVQERIAESISFLLIKSLVEESVTYQKLDLAPQGAIQLSCAIPSKDAKLNLITSHILSPAPGLCIQQLIDNNILSQVKPQKSKAKEVLSKKEKSDIAFKIRKALARPIANLIIKKSLENLKPPINKKKESEIEKVLSRILLEEIFSTALLNYQNEIINFLTKELQASQNISTQIITKLFHNDYNISSDKIKTVAEKVRIQFCSSRYGEAPKTTVLTEPSPTLIKKAKEQFKSLRTSNINLSRSSKEKPKMPRRSRSYANISRI